MKQQPDQMAYIGRKACGCVVAACMDDKDHPKYTAEDLAEFVMSGYTIERVPIEQARQMLTGCKCVNPPNGQKLSHATCGFRTAKVRSA